MTERFLAYSPTLYLVNSHVACYKIYVLKNPFNDEIFYVGQTVNDLSERLSGHIHQTGGSNRDKINYIRNIVEKGGKPIIEEVETIHTTCYVDKISVNEREMYWIKYYRGIGCTLYNIAKPKNDEYVSYLSSLKRGETKWHYYYCGETVGGYKVYDEKRLTADGFKFPVYHEPPQHNYNEESYQLSRMFKKLKRKSFDDPLFYDESAYNDCNPDYYDDDY